MKGATSTPNTADSKSSINSKTNDSSTGANATKSVTSPAPPKEITADTANSSKEHKHETEASIEPKPKDAVQEIFTLEAETSYGSFNFRSEGGSRTVDAWGRNADRIGTGALKAGAGVALAGMGVLAARKALAPSETESGPRQSLASRLAEQESRRDVRANEGKRSSAPRRQEGNGSEPPRRANRMS